MATLKAGFSFDTAAFSSAVTPSGGSGRGSKPAPDGFANAEPPQ